MSISFFKFLAVIGIANRQLQEADLGRAGCRAPGDSAGDGACRSGEPFSRISSLGFCLRARGRADRTSEASRLRAGRLYVGLSADCLTVGFSIYGTWGRGPKGALETVFRKRILTNRDLFTELLKEKVSKGRYETYWHREEKKEWAQHPGLPRHDEDWQTLHAWIVRKIFLPNARGLASPAFAEKVEEVFAQLYPLYVFTSASSPKWKAEVQKSI